MNKPKAVKNTCILVNTGLQGGDKPGEFGAGRGRRFGKHTKAAYTQKRRMYSLPLHLTVELCSANREINRWNTSGSSLVSPLG
jgi:hypothetical protein